tara:strand:+ start:515 stop:1429 length:915 start_codon:yes stop_codon:yes gene_type:complete
MGLLNQTNEIYYEGADGKWDSGDENYGDYQFTSLKNLVNNFMIAYVGEDKIISKIRRTDIAFHAQRAIQEFSFDTLPSQKSYEIEVAPSLYMILPQDYVNYVKVSWTDQQGNERIIYPTRNTSNPIAIAQDSDYEYTFDNDGAIVQADQSETLKKFNSNYYQPSPAGNSSNNLNQGELFNLYRYGRRYGLQPEEAQSNGVFYIDQLKGIMHFSSNLVNKIITLKYISDGVGTDEIHVHKFAEEAVYKYIAHAVLGTRANTPEYQVQRFKKEMVAAKRNAKLRLSNLKIAELAQVMRNQSKWIKH